MRYAAAGGLPEQARGERLKTRSMRWCCPSASRLAAIPIRPLPSTSCGDRRRHRSMNSNGTCGARSARRRAAIRTSGAIWSRCAPPRFQPAMRHQRGGPESVKMRAKKQHVTALIKSGAGYGMQQRFLGHQAILRRSFERGHVIGGDCNLSRNRNAHCNIGLPRYSVEGS
jgi:hypothetical protein